MSTDNLPAVRFGVGDIAEMAKRIVESPDFPRTVTIDAARKTIQNFIAKVSVSPSGCWDWNGARIASGYGKFSIRRRTSTGKRTPSFAHRVSHMIFVGPIPEGLTIDHLCKNKGCVNPAHLEAVTHLVNLTRSSNRVGQWSYTTHCNHGHERTPENTYTSPAGHKNCRECMRESDRKKSARRKAARANKERVGS